MATLSLLGLKAVIFDLNGTMVNDTKFHRKAWAKFFAEHDLEVDDAAYADLIEGRLNEEILPNIFKRPLGTDELARLSEERSGLYRRVIKGHVCEVEGLRSLLGRLRERGVRLALATCSPRANVDFILDEIRLEDAFEVIVSGDQLERGKPDPEAYQLALAELGLRPEECLAVEDSQRGIVAATAAGLRVLGIASSKPAELLRSWGAMEAADDFTQFHLFPAAVLVDLDGLLVDSDDWLYKATREYLHKQCGRELSRAQFGELLGYPGSSFYYGILQEVSGVGSEEELKQGIHALLPYRHIRLKKGASELLSYLAERGIPAVLMATTLREFLEERIAHLEVDGYFAKTICRGEGETVSAAYARAAAELGLSPADCLVLEDGLAGATAAREAGCMAWMVPSHYIGQEATSDGAEVFPDLHAVLERLQG